MDLCRPAACYSAQSASTHACNLWVTVGATHVTHAMPPLGAGLQRDADLSGSLMRRDALGPLTLLRHLVSPITCETATQPRTTLVPSASPSACRDEEAEERHSLSYTHSNR
ncbi:uncharacterized protein SCHCODRAFT_02627426 [Schizophyllum commune H4-8]|uniref:uncharacterized protein n=1 Tax=Schizophyllum commune (strain H4-8 / FGSC 9210) TaxID=578458 RepID=UPI00215E00DE|nr:uncharacterized protein SCHCODRAFT_02627426 [Schizophyllum commune H4-8]KAI5892895.1 hypothetical protein SCHCODRAFT_02627426 [Schizophyllum commune H4-8]